MINLEKNQGMNSLRGNATASNNLEATINQLFGCSKEQLTDACWEVIVKSNDYFGESKGEVVNIGEISWKDNWWCGTYGVVRYERNFVIHFRMYNKDGSPCGTTVHWTSLNGGLLCHGTRTYIPFKTKIKTIPVICVGIEMKAIDKDKQLYELVYFGGTEPDIQSKFALIDLIAKKRGINYLTISFHTEQIEAALYGDRKHHISCTRFLRRLLQGKYDIKDKDIRRVIKTEYLGTSVKPNKSVYKITYDDKSVEYTKIRTTSIGELVKYGDTLKDNYCIF